MFYNILSWQGYGKKTWTGFYTVGENAKWHNFHGYLAINSKITYALDYESILMFK